MRLTARTSMVVVVLALVQRGRGRGRGERYSMVCGGEEVQQQEDLNLYLAPRGIWPTVVVEGLGPAHCGQLESLVELCFAFFGE